MKTILAIFLMLTIAVLAMDAQQKFTTNVAGSVQVSHDQEKQQLVKLEDKPKAAEAAPAVQDEPVTTPVDIIITEDRPVRCAN